MVMVFYTEYDVSALKMPSILSWPRCSAQVGRMEGQFANPRSDSFEEMDGAKLPSYKGDNVNGDAFDEKSRIPDPQRIIRAYCQAAATLNLLRAFGTGGYAMLQSLTQWNLDFVEHNEQGERVEWQGYWLSIKQLQEDKGQSESKISVGGVQLILKGRVQFIILQKGYAGQGLRKDTHLR